ncbi:MAG TPA: peptide chain release factor N(5)-glutamine methyltransferase [Candidatus Limnocylindrales bacterium]|nr:peptide chain release factor N(5)-glutamine methyltransferase [Candidatus Limnocylindrales bacterium]
MTTVADLLRTGIDRLRASGSETPRLDAELLLGHAIGADRTVVLAHPEAPVSDDGAARFDADLARRERGEPVAYIRGFKEFYGLAFSTDPRALIPRPETERLVELAEHDVVRRLVAAPRPPGARPIRIADVGAGCGTIAVALAVALRRRRIVDEIEILGTDESTDALDLARENAVGHSVGDRARFIEADLLPPVVVEPFDLVLANLPYVRSDALPTLPIAASFEPARALDGGPDGLAVIRRLLERLPKALAPDGIALLEIGADQADGIAAAVSSALPGWRVTIEPDLAGAPRVARIERPEAAS